MGALEQVEQLPEEEVHREDVALVLEAVSKLGKRGERAGTPVLTRISHRGIIGGGPIGSGGGGFDNSEHPGVRATLTLPCDPFVTHDWDLIRYQARLDR